jgi:hypothetical protein
MASEWVAPSPQSKSSSLYSDAGQEPQRHRDTESTQRCLSVLNAKAQRREERQNRSASGTAAGEKTDGDRCLHLEASVFSLATGDSIACRSATKKRKRVSRSASTSFRPCAFAGRVDGWASRSLRFMGGWAAPCFSLCLCGFGLRRRRRRARRDPVSYRGWSARPAQPTTGGPS